MGKLLPFPYPGQSMDEYREQLVNFKKTYWSFLKPSKGGGKFIPLPPSTLIKKTKEMTRKLNKHVKEELFNKEKKATPKVEPKKDKKVIPPPPPSQEPRVIKEGEQPAKKKKPYYRKKYNKPKVEVVIPEPVKTKNYFIHGLIVGAVVMFVLCKLYFTYN